MANVKKAVQEEVTEKEIPRAAYEGVLTIDVDAQVESAQEQEDTRWHQLLNAHRTRKVLTGQLGGIEKLESGWMVAFWLQIDAQANIRCKIFITNLANRFYLLNYTMI